MTKHFENETAAKSELEAFGFRVLTNGNWFKSSALVVATILTIPGSKQVAVFYREAA